MLDDLLAQLKAARLSLVAQIAADMAPDQHLPDAGYLRLLADLQACIGALEAMVEEDE